jgi:NRPS condensation-like uncharacterized protein
MAALDEISSVSFQAIAEITSAIDVDVLALAWTRLAALHPILTCVRSGHRWRPSRQPEFGHEVAQPGHDQPPAAMCVTPLTDGVRLTMMCNHVAFDGVASRILLHDLRDEYIAVLDGRPPRRADIGARTFEAIARVPDLRTTAATVLRGSSTWLRTPVSTHIDPADISAYPADGHAILELGPVLSGLTELRRKHRWSVDAVLVGVLEKAWSQVFGLTPAGSSWLVARDLRPPLSISRGIGNLSTAAGVSLANPKSDLIDVIDEAERALAAQSSDLVTAAASVGRLGRLADMTFAQMLRRSKKIRAYRTVSNVGQLGHSLDSWGEARLERVWFVGPLAHPPFTSFIAAGKGTSTLVSVRVSPGWLTADHALAIEQAALELV